MEESLRILAVIAGYLLCDDDDDDELLLVAMEAAASSLFVRTRNFLTRPALGPPSCASHRFLLQGGDDRAFLITMGVNRDTFAYLLERFEPAMDKLKKEQAAARKVKQGKPVSAAERVCSSHFLVCQVGP